MGNNINTFTSDNDSEEFNFGNAAEVTAPQIAGNRAGGDITNTLTINNTNTDLGAVDGAFDLADTAIGSNKAIAGKAIDGGFDLANRAIDTVNNAGAAGERMAGSVIDFAGGETTATRNFAGKAIDTNTAANKLALEKIADLSRANSAALAAEQSASRGALLDTFKGSLGTITSFADKSFAAIDGAYDTLDNAYETSLRSLSSTVDKVTSSTVTSVAAFADANRSETAASFDKLVTYGFIGVTLVVLTIVIVKGK